MAISKVVYDGNTLIDLSGDTVTSSDHIMNGYVGHLANGTQVTGTGQGGGASQTVYCGTSTPSSGTGSDGDVYITASSGASVGLYPAAYTYESINSTSNLSKCIGISADDGNATGNVYSSSSGTTGYVYYTFDLPSIPSSSTISSISCRVMAHEENSSKSSFTLQLYSGSTAKGSETTVNGTSNTIYTLTCGSWTATELESLKLVMAVGYYGGLIAGATLSITYTISEATYEVTLSGTSSSWTISGDGIYQKSSGSWSSVSSVTLDSSIQRG